MDVIIGLVDRLGTLIQPESVMLQLQVVIFNG